MKYFLLFLCAFIITSCGKWSAPSIKTITDKGSKNFQQVIGNKDKYELQFIYTQIHRAQDGEVHLTPYRYNVDTTTYFYPASTVKMPVAFLALQKINELKASLNPAIDKNSTIHILAGTAPQTEAMVDTTAQDGKPTIAHYIAKIFAVSDNDAYNRLYEWLGQDYINQELRQKGIFSNSRIRTRVGISGFTTEMNKYTNPLSLISLINKIIYTQPELYATLTDYPTLQKTMKGKGYFVDATQEVIYKPFDMSEKNFINIIDLEASLLRVIYPALFLPQEQYNLSKEDYTFLKDIMQRTPTEHRYLQGKEEQYYDSYVKFFLYGDNKNPIPEHINIHNKVGYAYGYLTDCAYIQDTKNDIEFFLTATIHVNENQIYNDGKYEYENIGIPFLAELGRKVYEFELKKKKLK